MNNLMKLPNIGKNIEKELSLVGINNYEDLSKLGSKKTWLKIKKLDPNTCLSKLLALEGAIQKIRWHNLSANVKKELKEFYQENK